MFKHDTKVRNEVRNELGLDEKFVIGHVGRFCYAKNQEFVLNVFKEVYKQNQNAFLLFVGDGPDKKKVEKKVSKHNLSDYVLFLGNRNDTNRLYQAMDVFVFPSRYEGLGMAAVEAQFCGVRTLMSNRVPNDAVVADDALRLSLTYSAKDWAENILKKCDSGKISDIKCDRYDILKESIMGNFQ